MTQRSQQQKEKQRGNGNANGKGNFPFEYLITSCILNSVRKFSYLIFILKLHTQIDFEIPLFIWVFINVILNDVLIDCFKVEFVNPFLI